MYANVGQISILKLFDVVCSHGSSGIVAGNSQDRFAVGNIILRQGPKFDQSEDFRKGPDCEKPRG